MLLGPSGAGKSTLGQALSSEDWLHIELDQWPAGDGVDLYGLRPEWNVLHDRHLPGALAVELARRAQATNASGVVLSLPSRVLFEPGVLADCHGAGMAPVLLFGSREDCLRAFLRREQRSGRGLGAAHWDGNNPHQVRFASQEYARYRVEAFRDHAHRPLREITDEILNRIAAT